MADGLDDLFDDDDESTNRKGDFSSKFDDDSDGTQNTSRRAPEKTFVLTLHNNIQTVWTIFSMMMENQNNHHRNPRSYS